MTQQTQNQQVNAPDTPAAEVSSRLARIIGALRARREAVEQAEAVEPPVEWALRLMM